MAWQASGDAGAESADQRLFLLFFILFFVFLGFFAHVSICADLTFFFVLFLLVVIIGDDIQVDRMHLHDLEFDFTLGTTENLALFHFVFVDVDFCSAFGTANHGCLLRGSTQHFVGNPALHRMAYYIPRAKSTPAPSGAARSATSVLPAGGPAAMLSVTAERSTQCLLHGNFRSVRWSAWAAS